MQPSNDGVHTTTSVLRRLRDGVVGRSRRRRRWRRQDEQLGYPPVVAGCEAKVARVQGPSRTQVTGLLRVVQILEPSKDVTP